jgi:hypothetical protein
MDSATPDDPLWTIVYVSSASYAFSPLDLERLLASARLSNQAVGITGVLLHCHGNFMQLLEGPRSAVQAAFRRVRGSREHHGIIELLDEPAERRAFGDWSMASAGIGPEQFQALVGAADATRRQLLLDFWQANR